MTLRAQCTIVSCPRPKLLPSHVSPGPPLWGAGVERAPQIYNTVMPIPQEIRGQHYLSLATFRKTGVAVYTPVWFAEKADRIYLMTNAKLGKVKRIRNNPQVKIAPCTMRGKITGPEFPATARILPAEDATRVRRALKDKYWLARIPWIWRNSNTYIEITVG